MKECAWEWKAYAIAFHRFPIYEFIIIIIERLDINGPFESTIEWTQIDLWIIWRLPFLIFCQKCALLDTKYYREAFLLLPLSESVHENTETLQKSHRLKSDYGNNFINFLQLCSCCCGRRFKEHKITNDMFPFPVQPENLSGFNI